MQAETDKTYNGWTNYQTWAVKLWIDNEEGDYNYWREEAQSAWKISRHDKDEAIRILADNLEAYLQDNTPTVTGMYADLLNSAIGKVDVYEIAQAMIEDEEFEDEADESK